MMKDIWCGAQGHMSQEGCGFLVAGNGGANLFHRSSRVWGALGREAHEAKPFRVGARDALREHLRRLEVRTSEERDRQGYSRQPQPDVDAQGWESEAAWPQE
jgi:hypothetical protein